VDFASLNYEIFDGGGYGITVDTKSRVWLASSISRFDYATKQWANANTSTSGGIAQDLQGRMWAAGNNGVVWVDMETMAIGDTVALPYSGQVKGVSVDIDGYIWAVFQGDTRAFKIDPNTYAYEFYDGLNQPYTYSDMTGGQISNVNCNPPQG
jgi:streptogramin lyase